MHTATGQREMSPALAPWTLRGIIPALGGTPALRGYPGGIHPAGAGWSGQPEEHEEPGAAVAAPGRKSVWQQAWGAWQEAKLEWQRPPGWVPADTDLQRTEPIPVVPAAAVPVDRSPVSPPSPASPASPAPLASPVTAPGGDAGAAAGNGAAGDKVAAGDGAAGDKVAAGTSVTTGASDAGLRSPAGGDGQGADSGPGGDGPPSGDGGPGDGQQGGGSRAGVVRRAPRAHEAGRSGQASQRRPQPSRRAVLMATAGAAVLVVVAGVGITQTLGSAPGQDRTGPLVGAPSTQLADAQFTTLPGQPGPGTLPALTAVAAVGSTVVAVGSQATFPATRPLVLTSPDGGRTWQPAVLRIPAGGAAAGAAAVPVMVAGGRGGWLALGPDAAWTSPDGRSWLLGPGISPLADGDRVRALARTGSGFIAVGQSQNPPGTPGQGPTTAPVLWTSPDGLTWQRENAGQLQLPGRGGQVINLRWVAAHGSVIVIGGDVTGTAVRHRGRRKVSVVTETTGVWQSKDGGSRWQRADPPVTRGASAGLSGLAATGSGFVAIRPGHARGGAADAVVYVSADGSGWRFAAILAGHKGSALRLTEVDGNGHGAVATGSAGGKRVAFVSVHGRAWRQSADLGRSSASTVTAVTAGPRGEVVAAGASLARAPQPGMPGHPAGRSFLLLVRGRRMPVGQAALAAAAAPAVSVNSIAAAAGRQVAAGSAGGRPALWSRQASGHWSWVTAATPPFAPGAGPGLTSVVHGSAGWLAVGGEGGPGEPAGQVGSAGSLSSASVSASQSPILLTSADGRAWRPAPGSAPFAAPGIAVAQAAAGPAGYVVVGERVTHGRPTAALWWSATLTGWIPQRLPAGQAPASPATLLGVAAGSAGFAAVGAIGTHPAVWLSRTGQSWVPARLPVPAGARSAVLQQVAITGHRIAAIGIQAGPSGPVPFAAVSGNGGASWREHTLPVPGGPAGVSAIAAAAGGFVAAGTWDTAGSQHVIMWWSRDGLGWHRVRPTAHRLGGTGAQRISGLSVSGTVLSGVGYAATGTGQHPVLLLARVR